MSEIKIRRKNRSPSVTTTTSTTTCTTLRIDDMAGGVVSIGTISTNAATQQIVRSKARFILTRKGSVSKKPIRIKDFSPEAAAKTSLACHTQKANRSNAAQPSRIAFPKTQAPLARTHIINFDGKWWAL